MYITRRSLRGWQHNTLSDAGLSTCEATVSASVDPGGEMGQKMEGKSGANTRTYPDLLTSFRQDRVYTADQSSVKLSSNTIPFFGQKLHSHPTVQQLLWGNEGMMEAFNRVVRSHEALWNLDYEWTRLQ